MVAVGDDQLLVFHRCQHFLDQGRIDELPHAVLYAVFVGDLKIGGLGRFVLGPEDQLLSRERRVGVEHVNLFAIGAGSLEERQPVGFVLGERLFVAIDDVVGVVVQMAERDESPPLPNLVGSGHGVGLRVAVQRRLRFFAQNALSAPFVQGRCGAGVDVVGVGIAGVVLAENDADQVVRTGLVVGVLHGRRNLIVGLRDDVFKIDAG